MIKFYQDEYAKLSGLSGSANNICFATDRQVLIMGGKEYGKDQIKKVANVGDIATTPAAVGTLFVVTGEQAIYEKTATGASAVLSSVTDAIEDLKEELSAIVSTAYTENHVVLGSGSGITSSDFVLDTTTGALTGINTTLSTTLVNAATLSAAVADINKANAHVEAGNGISVLTGEPNANGTLYTVGIKLSDSISSSLKFDSASGLADDVYIEKLTTPAATGYAASYVLKNGKGTTLGETINIVRDQFLSSATLVTGTYDEETDTFTPGSGAGANRYLKLVFDVNTDGTGDDSEVQNTVYINVNELFDSYTGTSGVAVNNDTNQISAVVDGTTETGLGATNAKHYNGAFLTVGADGLKVNGIKNEISGYIQDLGSTTATTDKFVTNLGVDANGALTADVATPHASGITFNPNNVGSLTATTVQTAIEEVVADFDNLLSGLDVAQIGDTTTYIQAIKQEDGKIAASAVALEADKVAYSTTFENATATNVSGALDNIQSYISGLDYAAQGTVGTPSTGTPYTIINQVSETDGLISATVVDMTAANTYQNGVAAVATGDAADVRVAITSGTQASANDQFSNLIADYLSFHDASGDVI